MSVEIEFADLWTYDVVDPQIRRPVSSLPRSGEGHVHGRLTIRIDGRVLPHLGFFGPDDVCFNEWLHELHFAAARLCAQDPSTYTYDEGEQGQPAFTFERSGDRVWLSVIASEISDAHGDPAWQRVELALPDFCAAVAGFEVRLRAELLASAPRAAESWLARVLAPSAT